MRIIYYTHSAFFELALSLVRELSQHADVDFLLEMSAGAWRSAGFDVPERPLPPGIVQADPILAEAFPAGVRKYWQSARSFHLVVHPSRRSLDPRAWSLSREVLRFAVNQRADVLHIDDVDVSPRLALALPGSRHPPIAISVHDPEPHEGERDWRRTLARRLAYPSASRFILYNHALRDRFASRHGISLRDIDVARLGPYDVFREWSSPAEREEPPVVLFFGRLSPYKGLETLYAAWPLVAALNPGARLVIAGQPIPGYSPPPPRSEPHARVDIIDRYLSNSEAARLFESARVVVCPYRGATQSGVVLTAFAFRVPVVATDVGGLSEYVTPERTGLLVPADDPSALAAAIARLLADSALRSRIRDGIERALGDELSWRKTVDALLHTYAECGLHAQHGA